MDKLAVHIRQAHDDVKLVNTSAKKISGRFKDIDQVELPPPEDEEGATGTEVAGAQDQGGQP
jgi:DNA recombination protein RmuC